MKNQKVSVLLPNFNYAEFISERIESILGQTHTNLEVIVVDSYSNDGAWELIQEFGKVDPRIICMQAPRGLYQAWNICLSKASGDFVYIATSDDTMRRDSLEKMLEALAEYPDCGICDSKLSIIDQDGIELRNFGEQLPIYNYLDKHSDFYHIRHWPHDFLLYFSGAPVFTSMTQVLLRSDIARRVGSFSTLWGTKGDFEWGMKAAGLTSTIYIPEKLATWRVHGAQVTSAKNNEQNNNRHTWNYQMVRSALAYTLNNRNDFPEKLIDTFMDEYEFVKKLSQADTLKNEAFFMNMLNTLKLLVLNPEVMLYIIKNRVRGEFVKKHKNPGGINMKKLGGKYNMSEFIEEITLI